MHKIAGNRLRLSRIIILSLFFTFNCLYAMSHTLLFAQDKIIAIVNQDIITQKDLNDFVNFMRVQLSAEYKGKQLESKIESMKSDLLNKLIDDRLILQEAKKGNIRVNPERIKSRIADIKKNYGSDTEFQAAIAKQGLVQADIEQKISDQLLMYSIMDFQVKSKIKITPAEVTEFYQRNIKKFVSIEQREFESVTVDDAGLANEILNQLHGGQGLQEIADKYSLSINKYVCAKDGQLRKDIEEILFKMEVGKISPLIKIEESNYIFKLISIIPPRQLSLPEAQDSIQTLLYNNRSQQELTKWLDDLKKRSYIKISQF